jgi:signal transduction histidine kinase
VTDRLPHGGLRAQLTVAIAVVTLIAVGASFLALYGDAGTRLRAQLDGQLRAQDAQWRQFLAAGAQAATPRALQRTAQRFIAAQRYHAESLIIVIQVTGARTLANDPEVVAREEDRRGSSGLLDAASGLTTASVREAGTMRVLTAPIDSGPRRVGTFRVAVPLSSVTQAQSSLVRSFLLVGGLALVLAVLAGVGLAALIAAPLRRIARVAAAVDGGDLSLRAGPLTARGEVRTLSESFDHMLERLEQAFTRQREFVSDASHELRTPLSVLRAQVELLDRELDPQRRRDATATLLARIDALDRLVGDMLTRAGAEAGQLVRPELIELDGFFEDLRRDLPLFGERDFQLQAAGGELLADPDRLTQVLRNLVRNAVAHTEPGGRVTVAARGRGDRLEISVTDTGPGIPPDQLERIFERFHRLDGGRTRDRGGSGLGLAIARAIIEAHGGRIRAESVPGRGATFRAELPNYRPSAAPAASPPPPTIQND